MDSELRKEIHQALTKNGNISEQKQKVASELADEVAKRFLRDRSMVWWWEALLHTPVVIEYGEGVSWPLVKRIVQNDTQIIYLFVTDDDPEPWQVLKGTLHDIGLFLAELWRVEYFITDENLSWLIFDTHHNSLVVSGTLMNRTVALKGSTGLNKAAARTM